MRCRSFDRRAAVRAADRLTGIDDVDYLRADDDAGGHPPRARRPRLRVRLLGDAPAALLRAGAFVIEGGRRVRGIRVEDVRKVDDPEGDTVLELALDAEGDASIYTLRVVGDPDRDHPPAEVDPRYDRASFSFRLDCANDLDCADGRDACGADDHAEPVLDYLAKDYASFRQLLLDRMSLVLPAWRERHVPDVGITLVELLAYAGDQLSYRQDVVATEAYLDTARLRTSVRRHARLVDYLMHEGVNARAWVAVCVGSDVTLPAKDVTFYTRVAGWQDVVDDDVVNATSARYEVFRPLDLGVDLALKQALGRIRFYTWGGEECCLPRGATRATLILPPADVRPPSGDPVPTCDPAASTPAPAAAAPTMLLGPGDVLILEEVRGPGTGRPEHADPAHRHAVRLTRVELVRDPLVAVDPATRAPLWLHEVEWMAEDALPFPLCLSSLDPSAGCAPIDDVSVARGNVVLVDHGRPATDRLPCVEAVQTSPVCEAPRRPAFTEPVARRYRPVLSRRPLTFSAPVPTWTVVDAGGHTTTVPPPASAMLRQDPRAARPAVSLTAGPCFDPDHPTTCARCGTSLAPPTTTADVASAPATSCRACGAPFVPRDWVPRRDLLDSSGDDAHFAVEMDDGGAAHLRFGDDVNGLAPEPWTSFEAWYRVGNGPSGNVPSEAIAHIAVVGTPAGSGGLAISVRNPLPAVGGTAPEPVDDVRFLAPASLRARRERAIIADDYAELALRDHAALQRAAATLRWTGSWYEVEVGLDPWGTASASPTLRATVERDLERYRRIGHDLRVEGAHDVPVQLALTVCAAPAYLRGHVRAAVLDALVGPGGFFRPDRFTFGEPLRLSALVAEVQSVAGVIDVAVTRMERLFEGDRGELEAGELRVGSLEIVQLDNDPSLPERGQITLSVRGGR